MIMSNPSCAAFPGGSPFAGCSLWEGPQATSVWQRLAVSFLALIALVCIHCVLWHLHAILVPFFVSGFIVFALQPSVEVTYKKLAGRSPPHRWFYCCCLRERRDRGKGRAEMPPYGSCQPDQIADEEHGSNSSPRSQPRNSQNEETLTDQQPLLAMEVPTIAIFLADAACRFLAVAMAVLSILFIASVFLVLLGHGAMHMKDNWEAYKSGIRRVQRLQDHLVDVASKEMGMQSAVEEHVKQAYDQLLGEAQGIVWLIVNELVSGLSEGVSQLLIILLYVIFWLMQPLPTGGKVSSVVRSYLWKKSFVSALYGSCVALLFYVLEIDLALFFGTVSFFFNFVPEVGAFISMLVPVPVILLDGRLENPILVLTIAIIGQVTLKFIVGNVLEVKLIERDREMNIHPVWIILGLSYFGFVWGPLGALLSVPLMAIVKTAALSVRGEVADPLSLGVVPTLLEAFLACFEGRHTCWDRPEKAEEENDVETKSADFCLLAGSPSGKPPNQQSM